MMPSFLLLLFVFEQSTCDLQAANSAGRELDLFLATFDPSDVANAREILLDAGEPAR
jgi:hypothetical protein